MVDEKTVVT
jgi:hypothetical protein